MRRVSFVAVVALLGLAVLFSYGCAGSSPSAPSSTSAPPAQPPAAPADPVVLSPIGSAAITLHYNEGLTADVFVSDAIHAAAQMIAACVSWREGYVMPICGASDVSKGTRQPDGTWKYTVSGATVKGAWPQNQVTKTVFFGAVALPAYSLFKANYYDATRPDVPLEGLDRPLSAIQWLPLEVNWMPSQSLVASPVREYTTDETIHPLLRSGDALASHDAGVQFQIGR